MEKTVLISLPLADLQTLIIDCVNSCLKHNSETVQPANQDRWFDLDELTDYDPEKRTRATFYGYVHRKEIPFHKRGKKLYFLKSEIDEWLKAGRKKTVDEIEADAKKEGGKR